MVDAVSGSFAAPPARRYDLHFREGPSRALIPRYRNKDIALTAQGLEWFTDGQRRYTDYATISAIHLSTGHIPKAGAFGACVITFRNGRDITVASLDAWGSPDPERYDDYAEFLQDLHARLSDEDRERIRFHAGTTPGKQLAGRISLGVGGAFFVILPLVLLLLTGEIKALFLAIGGIAFVGPAIRTLRRNAPRGYDPRHLDEDLFPHT